MACTNEVAVTTIQEADIVLGRTSVLVAQTLEVLCNVATHSCGLCLNGVPVVGYLDRHATCS